MMGTEIYHDAGRDSMKKLIGIMTLSCILSACLYAQTAPDRLKDVEQRNRLFTFNIPPLQHGD